MARKEDEIRAKLQKMAIYIDKKKAQATNTEGADFLREILEVVFEMNEQIALIKQENGMSDSFVEITGPNKLS